MRCYRSTPALAYGLAFLRYPRGKRVRAERYLTPPSTKCFFVIYSHVKLLLRINFARRCPMVIKLVLLLALPRCPCQQIRRSILNFFPNLLNRPIVIVDNRDGIFGKDVRRCTTSLHRTATVTVSRLLIVVYERYFCQSWQHVACQ